MDKRDLPCINVPINLPVDVISTSPEELNSPSKYPDINASLVCIFEVTFAFLSIVSVPSQLISPVTSPSIITEHGKSKFPSIFTFFDIIDVF